jgi:hypothetical protein
LEGADTYDVGFGNGALLRFAILLDAQGLTTLAGIRPAPLGRWSSAAQPQSKLLHQLWHWPCS